MSLSKESKIYVAGHNGLVGSAIWKNLKERGYNNLIGRSHKELDLTNQQEVRKFFEQERPDAVVLAAAFVGAVRNQISKALKILKEGSQKIISYFFAIFF